jgi:hypothetical protein
MESADFDSTVAVLVAVLVSLGRLASVLFGTLKVCIKEYYDFRRWLAAQPSDSEGRHRL